MMILVSVLLLSFALTENDALHFASSQQRVAAQQSVTKSRRQNDAISWKSADASQRQRRLPISALGAFTGEEKEDNISTDSALFYKGPVLQDPSQIVAGLALGELGLEIFVAPSTVVPNQLGLFAMLAEDTERVTLPALTLLCGYSREGTFRTKDEGDKTVGFSLGGSNTAVFFQQKLMSILDALELAASTTKDGACGLAGHVLEQDENGNVELYPDNNPEFQRYYVPALMNHEDKDNSDDNDPLENLSVQNFGQFCNDLAWNYDNPPTTKDEYMEASKQYNVVQLVWRLELNTNTNLLVPSWPVSVLARDVRFENTDELYELGTQYGWNYWQATVELDNTS